MVAISRRIWRDASGQDMIEYALLAAFAAIVAAAIPFQGTTALVTAIHSKIYSVLVRSGG